MVGRRFILHLILPHSYSAHFRLHSFTLLSLYSPIKGSPHIIHASAPRVFHVLLHALVSSNDPRLLEASLKALNALVQSQTAECMDAEDFAVAPLPVAMISVSLCKQDKCSLAE